MNFCLIFIYIHLRLVLIPTGNLMILSSNRYIIWSTSTQHLTSASQEKGSYINGTFMTKNEKFSYPFNFFPKFQVEWTIQLAQKHIRFLLFVA